MTQLHTSFNRGWSKMFVSYCHKDEAFVNKLLPYLRKLSPVVIDQDGKLITAGDFMPESITDGIKECRLGLCFISNNSIDSDWVRFELNVMKDNNHNGKIAIIPILLNSFDEIRLPDQLEFIKKYYCVVITDDDPNKVMVEIRKAINKNVEASFPLSFCGYRVGNDLLHDEYTNKKEVIETVFGKIASCSEVIHPSDNQNRNICYMLTNATPEIPFIFLDENHYRIYAKPFDQQELDGIINLIEYSRNSFWLVVTFRRMIFTVDDFTYKNISEVFIKSISTDLKKIKIVICDLTAIDDQQTLISILRAGREVFLELAKESQH